MCFGIRIASQFHLNTLNIPLQNIKCPKNTKNACADIIFSPAIICEAWTVLSLRSHAKPNLCDRQCYPWITLFVRCFVLGYVIKDESDYRVLLFLLQSMKCASMCFTHHLSHDSIVMSANAFLVFLRHLIFWMGMLNVFRWDGLKILIPKHMWKSIIGPLGQI